ncbi:MAG TPA: GNAT family N-acetyltransferase [Thermoanaerobaculia bacterium]
MNVRPAEPKDRERIQEILTTCMLFTEEEVRCAVELVDIFLDLEHPESADYQTVVVEDGEVEGYVTFGPTPLTDGVYDLYWIAVDRKQQGRGFGQILLRFVENEVRRRNGRMLLIETSSKGSYASTLRFYERAGYEEISRIKDFYRIEDDKLVFCKRLTA